MICKILSLFRFQPPSQVRRSRGLARQSGATAAPVSVLLPRAPVFPLPPSGSIGAASASCRQSHRSSHARCPTGTFTADTTATRSISARGHERRRSNQRNAPPPSPTFLSPQSHPMRNLLVLLLAQTLIACTGCAWHRDAQALNALITAAEPLHTPFDSDTTLRRAYLEGYREGYKLGLSGKYIIGGHDPDARSRGRSAGNVAGWNIYRHEEARRSEETSTRDLSRPALN
jgi:hypothetical protein